MGHLLEVVADFCRWSGMQVKLEKSVATAFDFKQQQELSTADILYQGTPLVHLAASWPAPPAALGEGNGRQPRPLTWRLRRPTSLPPPRS